MIVKKAKRKSQVSKLYDQAVVWLAVNNDTSWVEEDPSGCPVEVALVADLFGQTTAKVQNDVRWYLDNFCTPTD